MLEESGACTMIFILHLYMILHDRGYNPAACVDYLLCCTMCANSQQQRRGR
jgi:hypothetical protein